MLRPERQNGRHHLGPPSRTSMVTATILDQLSITVTKTREKELTERKVCFALMILEI